jgi:ADP-ribose pyrophosphatase YjhB (NUDIX family)
MRNVVLKKQSQVCCNCGGEGHSYKQCNQPIISYGLIVYRFRLNKLNNTLYPEYLMVQRKDTLTYVEFLRGKYTLENVSYIKHLFSRMTHEEHTRIISTDFMTLWNSLWSCPTTKVNYIKEMYDSEKKFQQLKKGYNYLSKKTNLVEIIDLQTIICDVMPLLTEPEWGFPKGRRNYLESDKSCALREFREETGVKTNRIRIKFEKPVDEVFMGSNFIRYKHVYYIAEYIFTQGENDLLKFQESEIRNVSWFMFPNACTKLEVSNVEKRELLKRVNTMLIKKNVGRCF